MLWSELYPITKEDEEEILRINGVTEEQIRENVDILEDWYRKQQHFPEKYPYEHFLSRYLSINGFSVETTKKQIESYFTMKSVYRDIYKTLFNVDDTMTMPTENCFIAVPMPELGPKRQRICLGGIKTSDVSAFNMKNCDELLILAIEFAIQFDKITSAIVVIDCKNARLEMITKIDFMNFMKMTNLVLNAYEPDLVEAVHLLNLNKPSQMILNIFKKIVRHKIIESVHIHKNLESLYEFVPKEYLPEEYGGTQGSMSKIISLMDAVLLENKQYLLDLPKYAADDSLRLGANHYNNIFGTEGTFRALNID